MKLLLLLLLDVLLLLLLIVDLLRCGWGWGESGMGALVHSSLLLHMVESRFEGKQHCVVDLHEEA